MLQHYDVQKTSEIIQGHLDRFPILFNWSYVQLHILCMTGAKVKAIELALHMDSLGWLDVDRKKMVVERFGDVFTNNNLSSCSEPIKVYAVRALKKAALRSRIFLDEEDIQDPRQLLQEMRILGWFNHKGYSQKQLQRLRQPRKTRKSIFFCRTI